MSTVITLEQLNDYSTTPVDPARGQLIVDAVNDYITNQTGRSWGSSATATEVHDFAPVIFLNHVGSATITSVTVGRPGATPTTLSPTSYYVNEVGRLVLSEYRCHSTPRSVIA